MERSDPLLDALREQLEPDYRVEEELGRGGMAVVYRATELELRRPVALKVLPPELALHTETAERFKREARLTAALDHPNIIPVYRVGQAGRMPYIAMRYVEGRGLDAAIEAQRALPLPVVLLVMRAAAAALAYAHERGIIHRDVKSGNILIDTDGRVLVTDFGIARALTDTGLTITGNVVGTPHYMSPEQCTGRALGPQSDQYSLGVVAFQMLTGTVPFEADSVPAVMQLHCFNPPPDVAQLRTTAPPALAALVTRALAKAPEDRFPTTREMLAALEAIPLSDAERRRGEEMLRELARGAPVPHVSSDELRAAPTVPALGRVPAGRGLGRPAAAAHAWLAAGGRRARRSPLLAAAVLAVPLLVGAGVYAYAERVAPAAAVRRGAALYARGDREGARRTFAEIAADHPRLVAPHIYLGRLARERGDFSAARRELERAIQLDPGSAAAMREMGALLLATGSYELARRFYMRAVALDPSDRSAQGYLGCALVRLGRSAEAARPLAQAGTGPWSACASASAGARRRAEAPDAR